MLAVLCPSAVGAQIPLEMDPGRSERTRADLEAQLARFEEFLRSPAYSESLKRSVRANAELIRARLENGDFRLGDRVVLTVQGEANLQGDTISVQAGPVIQLPLFGDVPLRGVLRSEVQEHITEHLRSFIREPVVRAQGLFGGPRERGAFGVVVPADFEGDVWWTVRTNGYETKVPGRLESPGQLITGAYELSTGPMAAGSMRHPVRVMVT